MALKTLVKVGGTNNLSDARYCAGMGVEIVGFDLDKNSDNYVDVEKFKAIVEWLEGVHYAGEFQSSSLEEIQQAISDYSLSYVQTNNTTFIEALYPSNVKFILDATALKQDEIAGVIAQNRSALAYIILDGNMEETHLKKFAQQASILIDGGINAKNIESFLGNIKPKGINLKGGTEIAPGLIDFDELADILEAIEID